MPPFRSGKVNIGLLVVLGVLVVVAGAVWTYRAASAPKIVMNPGGPPLEFVIRCVDENCGHSETVSAEQLKSMKTEKGMYHCSKCNKYSAIRNRKSGGSVVNP